jgi:hypothetical protein
VGVTLPPAKDLSKARGVINNAPYELASTANVVGVSRHPFDTKGLNDGYHTFKCTGHHGSQRPIVAVRQQLPMYRCRTGEMDLS